MKITKTVLGCDSHSLHREAPVPAPDQEQGAGQLPQTLRPGPHCSEHPRCRQWLTEVSSRSFTGHRCSRLLPGRSSRPVVAIATLGTLVLCPLRVWVWAASPGTPAAPPICGGRSLPTAERLSSPAVPCSAL